MIVWMLTAAGSTNALSAGMATLSVVIGLIPLALAITGVRFSQKREVC